VRVESGISPFTPSNTMDRPFTDSVSTAPIFFKPVDTVVGRMTLFGLVAAIAVAVVVPGPLFPMAVFVADVVEPEAEVPVFVFGPGGSDDNDEGRCTF